MNRICLYSLSQMSLIEDILTTFSKPLRGSCFSENVVFCLTSTTFPWYSISFWLTLSQNKKKADDPRKQVGFIQQSKQRSVNIHPRSPDKFLPFEMQKDCILDGKKILFDQILPSSTLFNSKTNQHVINMTKTINEEIILQDSFCFCLFHRTCNEKSYFLVLIYSLYLCWFP